MVKRPASLIIGLSATEEFYHIAFALSNRVGGW